MPSSRTTPRPLLRFAAIANCSPMTAPSMTRVLMIGCCMMMPPVAMPIMAPITVGTIVRASSR